MKLKISVVCVIVLFSMLFPLIAMGEEDSAPALETMTEVDLTPLPKTAENLKFEDFQTFKILSKETGEITEISATDYIIGVVSSEMPALYHKEALKAQAVAAFTYAARKKLLSKEDYDLTTDYNVDQCYISKDALKEKWGENYEEYYTKISDAVKEVEGLAVTYDGSLALTVYHAISPGKTENCKDVWGGELPYLVSVDSSQDTLAKNYKTTARFSLDEVKSKLKDYVNTDISPEKWFSTPTRTDSGRVTEITFCQNTLKGSEVSDAFDLRSANFTVEYTDKEFVFTVLGYGHGVGMSQNGGNEMAKSGSDFKEILSHYYKGATLKKMG